MNTTVPESAFKSGVLSKEFHERLLADLTRITKRAGIPPEFVWSRLSEYCSSEEIEWVKAMKRTPASGGVFTGTMDVPVTDKMMAITGLCLRNFTDARYMTLQQVISALKAGTMDAPTVLLIPNFCIGKAGVDDIPQWEVSALLGLLYQRQSLGKKTLIYVGSMTALEKNYGQAFKQHIDSHYTVF